MPILKLDEEEPLILDQIHNEKIVHQEEKKAFQKTSKQLSPAARKMVNEAKVDLTSVIGTGKNGVVLKEDVMVLMGSKPAHLKKKKTWA